MNNLNGVENNDSLLWYHIPPEEENLINKKLPTEVFEKVLSYLDDRSMQQASSASKFWNQAVLQTAKRTNISKIRNFCEFLISNLNKDLWGILEEKEIEIKKVSDIISNVTDDAKLSGFVSLSQIKTSVCTHKTTIVTILNKLHIFDLNDLERLSNKTIISSTLENVFKLARLYKKLDKAYQMEQGICRECSLDSIAEDLTEIGHFDEAIKVTSFITDSGLIENSHTRIVGKLVDRGNAIKAIEVARSLRLDQASLLENFFGLVDAGVFDKARKIANVVMLYIGAIDRKYLTTISLYFAKIGDKTRAFQVINMISDDTLRQHVRNDIKRTLFLFQRTGGRIY